MTIIIPEWFLWVFSVLMSLQVGLNIVAARLQYKLAKEEGL